MKTKQFGAIRPHSTGTDDAGSWDASAATAGVNANESDLRGLHAYQDPEGDPDAKGSYSFPHHNVGADGTPGAANTAACSSGIAALNGGRGGHSLSTDDKVGVHDHLAKHLDDAGKDVPDLKGAGAGDANASIDAETFELAPDGSGEVVPEQDNSFSMPVMVIEGAWTGDGRYIVPGALTWRDLPLPAMALTKTTMGHDDADLVGRIDSMDRRGATEDDFNSRLGQPYDDGTNIIFANGTFDTDELAASIKHKVGEQFLRGVSVDIGDTISELVYLDINGDECPESESDDDDDWFWDLLFGFSAATSTPQPGEPYSIGEKITSGRIMGATMCPFQAFEGAYVVIGDSAMVASADRLPPADDEEKIFMPGLNIVDRQGARKVKNSLVASGDLAAPMVPPVTWFDDLKLDGPTAITIDKSGEIYGHLAVWSECHMSYINQCIKAPHSATDYAYYQTGAVLCDDDTLVPTGVITMNTGHAELWMSADEAKAHYDHTGMVVADVAAGEDAFGIWIHGSMRPDTDQMSIRRLRGAALSGDWRDRGGNLELVAALAVNVPGFAVKRPRARIASGAPTALVAAGRLTQRDAQRLANLRPPTPHDDTSSGGYSPRDMDVISGYIKRDLRSQVHKDRR
jgi:hypothetical protein